MKPNTIYPHLFICFLTKSQRACLSELALHSERYFYWACQRMNTRLLKETLLLDERAVRGTGQLGKEGSELLCCLISAGSRNTGILTIQQVSTISHDSPYIYCKISRLLYHFLEVMFTHQKHQHYFQTRLAGFHGLQTLKADLSSAKFYSCISTAPRVNNFHGPGGWSAKSDSASCTALQDLLSVGTNLSQLS